MNFSEDGDSCIIRNPRTPRYWYNYLWNENRYCAQISQIGHGRSYYLSEKAEMCMINRDDARYVYLRDEGQRRLLEYRGGTAEYRSGGLSLHPQYRVL